MQQAYKNVINKFEIWTFFIFFLLINMLIFKNKNRLNE